MKSEEKQDIAAECRRLIAEASKKGAGYRTVAKGKVAEIALAALTGQPVAWLVELHEPMTDDYCREVKTVQLEKPTGHYMACATPLIRAAGYEVQQ